MCGRFTNRLTWEEPRAALRSAGAIRVIHHRTAIYRQINKGTAAAHHDALEFPDGEIMLLTIRCEGQQATVLQLPAEPKTAVESEAERRAAHVS